MNASDKPVGIFGYFRLLTRGEFPQPLFLKWLEKNDVPDIRTPGPQSFNPEGVASHLVCLAVLSTIALSLAAFSLVCVLLSPLGAHAFLLVFEKLVGANSLLIFPGASFYIVLFVVYLGEVIGFRNNLYRFQADIAAVKGFFGDDILSVDDLPRKFSRAMIDLAKEIRRLEKVEWSPDRDCQLDELRSKMKVLGALAEKFDVATVGWKIYFDEAEAELRLEK